MADPAPIPAPQPATPAMQANGAVPIPGSTSLSGSSTTPSAGVPLCMNGCGNPADRKNTCPTCQT